MPKIAILFLLPLFVWGCSAHGDDDVPPHIRKLNNLTAIPEDVKPAHDIHFNQDATYGDTKDVLVGDISSVAVTSSGRVFVGNSDKGLFYVYAPDGTFLSRLGKKGRGPGEFTRFWNPAVTDHTLYVYDPYLHRISLFSTDSLRVINTLNLGAANQATNKTLRRFGLHYVYPWTDGTFLAEFSPNHITKMNPDSLSQKFFLINASGKIISHQIFEEKGLSGSMGFLSVRFGGRQQGAPFKFAPRSLMAISPDHHIVAAWSADFLIKEYNPEGHYLQALYYAFKKVSLSEEEAIKRQEDRPEYFQKVLRHAEIPPTWPALNALKVDNKGRLWVATIVKNMNVYQWWVLNRKKGQLLARFTWPRAKPIKVIKNGYLYTIETNEKTGVKRVVRYKIMMNGTATDPPADG